MSEHPRYHERQVLLVRHGQTALNGAGRAPRPAGPATVRCELPRSAGSGSSLPNANAGPWLRSTWPWTPPPPQGRCSATCCSPWPGSRNASSGNAPATPSPSRRPPGSGSADPPALPPPISSTASFSSAALDTATPTSPPSSTTSRCPLPTGGRDGGPPPSPLFTTATQRLPHTIQLQLMHQPLSGGLPTRLVDASEATRPRPPAVLH